MNTTFLLLAQYGATAVVPIEAVCRDYFTHLTPEKLLRKIGSGDVALPLVQWRDHRKPPREFTLRTSPLTLIVGGLRR